MRLCVGSENRVRRNCVLKRAVLKVRYGERLKSWEDEEEDAISYWMTLTKTDVAVN